MRSMTMEYFIDFSSVNSPFIHTKRKNCKHFNRFKCSKIDEKNVENNPSKIIACHINQPQNNSKKAKKVQPLPPANLYDFLSKALANACLYILHQLPRLIWIRHMTPLYLQSV